MLTYRTKVTLANVSEELAQQAYAHNYGCAQSVRQDHWVALVELSDSVKSPYLNKRLEDANAFIDRLLQG